MRKGTVAGPQGVGPCGLRSAMRLCPVPSRQQATGRCKRTCTHPECERLSRRHGPRFAVCRLQPVGRAHS